MTLDEICERHGADKSTANGWHGYAPYYQELFEPLRHEPIKLLEIGVCFGASIKAWLEYFDHPQASICGVDVINNFPCNDPRYTYTQGDQGDPTFWKSFNPFLAPWTICVDDGPHTIVHQIISFNALWPQIVSGGFYIIEDCWTWPDPIWKQDILSAAFMRDLVWGLNRNGKKYYGRPGGKDESFVPFAEGIEWIKFFPGLMILKKR